MRAPAGPDALARLWFRFEPAARRRFPAIIAEGGRREALTAASALDRPARLAPSLAPSIAWRRSAAGPAQLALVVQQRARPLQLQLLAVVLMALRLAG